MEMQMMVIKGGSAVVAQDEKDYIAGMDTCRMLENAMWFSPNGTETENARKRVMDIVRDCGILHGKDSGLVLSFYTALTEYGAECKREGCLMGAKIAAENLQRERR